MAILLLGKSICPICNETIMSTDEYRSFPAFAVNMLDPLFFFSDSSFHWQCLTRHASGAKAISLSERFLEQIKPSNRICYIGGNLIARQEDHIFIDLLSSDPSDNLYQYNFLHLDRNNLGRWEQRGKIVSQLLALQKNGTWQELNSKHSYLGTLIEELAS